MNLLIDTQILIWSLDVNSPLSRQHKEILENTDNRILVSQVSLMELAIKKNINKLPEFVPTIPIIVDQLLMNGFELLNLTNDHISALLDIPLVAEHKDPFDRFLIAIAKNEKLPIMTTDIKFKLYSSFVDIV